MIGKRFDDITLPTALRDHLLEIERQIRMRWLVYEDWGFERLCPMGRGITEDPLFFGAALAGGTALGELAGGPAKSQADAGSGVSGAA